MTNQLVATIVILRDATHAIVSITGEFPVAITKNTNSWVAFAPDLVTLGYSTESAEDALEDLQAAIDQFFRIHRARNTVDDALQSLQWSPSTPHQLTAPKRFNTDMGKTTRVESVKYKSATAAA
jgi:predicted RNase H-like HicB family nuclease